MYTITHRHDELDIYAKTVTIDSALVEVKKFSRQHGRAVVRDGGRIRVVATNGRAVWVIECKCKGTGCRDGKSCGCLDGPAGRGYVEDLIA